MASKHCHSRLCSFVSLTIWYVLLATEKHPWGSSNEAKDFKTAWHWPSLKCWWWWGAVGQISALILQDLSRNTFHCKMNGCWPTLECLSYFARFSPQGVQNSTSMYTSGEIHSCAVGSAENLQSSLLPLGLQIHCTSRSAFHPLFAFFLWAGHYKAQEAITIHRYEQTSKQLITCD